MDLATTLQVVTLVSTTIVAGYIRFVQSQLETARATVASNSVAMTEFRIEVAKEYVRHEDLRRIEDTLVRIETKLDLKADK